MRSFRRRLSRVLLGASLTALVALPAPVGLPAAAADVDPGDCPPTWEWPGIGNGDPEYWDYNIATYVGGDFAVTGASAEAEGRMLVMGASLFDRRPVGMFNLGRVGVGSQVAPPGGSAMYLTGSSLQDDFEITAGNRVEVAHGVEGGGRVLIGGDLLPEVPPLELNGGYATYQMGAEATAAYADFGSRLQTLSNQLGAQPATATVTVDGNRLAFRGTGEAGVLQVFELDAAVLGQPTVELAFTGIPEETPVVVNVRGGSARMNPVHISDDGVRADDFASDAFARVAVRTMWNFTEATTLDLAGTGQILGSILATRADAEVSASTNGRLYVGGDLTLDGFGNELHSYHWPWSLVTECKDEETPTIPPMPIMGSVGLLKRAGSDPMAFTLGEQFRGLGTCGPTAVSLPLMHSWKMTLGEEDRSLDLPVDATCRIVEFAPVEEPGDVRWEEPVIEPETFVVPVPEAEEGVVITVDVTNTATAPFSVAKSVRGPDGTDDGFTGTSRVFSVGYRCTLDGSVVNGFDDDRAVVPGSGVGVLPVRAGEVATSLNFPLGAVCELTEALTAEDGDFDLDQWWTTVELVPDSTVRIGTDPQTRHVEVVNHFDAVRRAAFAVVKQVVDPGGVFDNPGRSFAIDYGCTLDGLPAVGYDGTGQVVSPDGTGTLAVGLGGPQPSPLFATGTVCLLAEDLASEDGDFGGPGHVWSDIAISPNPVVVDADAPSTVTATVTNTVAAVTEPFAPFAVTKSVEGPDGTDDGFGNPGRAFAVDYVCTLDGAPSIGYGDEVGSTVVDPDGRGTLGVRAGETAGSPFFVPGTVCALSEDLARYVADFPDQLSRWTDAEFDPASTIEIGTDPADPVTVRLTNRFTVDPEPEPGAVLGTLTLGKAVDGPEPGVVDPDLAFTFSLVCTADGYDPDGQVVLPAGTAETLTVRAGREDVVGTPLFAVGTACTFEETRDPAGGDFGDRDDEFAWLDTQFNMPMPVLVTDEAATPVEVVAANVFTRRADPSPGSFAVLKVVEGPDPDALADGLEFDLSFGCTWNGTPAVGHDPADPDRVVAPEGTGRLTVRPGGPAVQGPLFMPGSECRIGEDLDGRAGDFVRDGLSWAGAEFVPGPVVTIPADATADPVGVRLVNRFVVDPPTAPGEVEGEVDGSGPLAVTGARLTGLALLATLLILGGVLARTVHRRRS